MELDFDKEIDALMRRKDFSPPATGFPDGEHLGADEIAAFADNALPDAGRAVYMRHLAACDRCRTVLSSVVSLNAEGVVVEQSDAPLVASIAVPWYRGPFRFPGLAYGLGGLIVVFAGFLGFSIVQNSRVGPASDISQVSQEPAPQQSGPGSLQGEPFSQDPPNSANASANSAANSNSSAVAGSVSATTANTAANVPTVPAAAKPTKEVSPSRGTENSFVVDGTEVTGAPPPSASAADSVVAKAPERKDSQAESQLDLNMQRQEMLQRGAAQQQMQTQEDSRSARAKRAAANAQSKILSGPSRDMNSQYGNSQIQSLPLSGRRIVSGRNFELRQGVWYDAGYSGQATTNVSRGTETYIRLDGGLRNIADSLGGTVVLVWKGKAYRIQ